MFIGHFGAGFTGKKFDKNPSLGTYFMAAQFVDLIWPIMLLLGIEKVVIEPGNTTTTPLDFAYYPFTHSLIGVIFWALLFGLVYFLFKKNLKAAFILGALVISHWILDLIVHRPDLPIIFGVDLKVGFGLWNNLAATVIVEGLIFIGGLFIYLKSTKAKNKTGTFALLGLVAFLIIIYISNLFGPPPQSTEAIGIVGNAQWLIVLWGYWINKNRE
jgi:LexA-binding, inner membrane-associated putative hydrolase